MTNLPSESPAQLPMPAQSKLPSHRQLEQLPLEAGSAAEFTRAAASLSLVTFAETFYQGWIASRCHELIAAKLEDCYRRNIRRLAISIPPQHGKSKLSSVCFPAWAMTKNPTLKFFQAGFNGDLSKGFSREARALVDSDRYKQFYPDLINMAVNRQEYWQTKLAGYYYATSVGGGTGTPADFIIIDDPHKDRAEANSESQRNRIWEWFTSTATTRLAPDGVVIVIQTRWHKDDLIGRLTDPKRVKEFTEAGFTDMNFEVLSLEAICENPATDQLGRQMGEALWPEKRGERELAIKRKEIGNFEWNSLYQQRPNPPGGNVANIHNIKTIDFTQLPKGLRRVRGWDLALSNSTRADFSCGAMGAMDSAGNLYLMHMDRKRRLWPEQKAAIVAYAKREAMGGDIAIEAVSAFRIGASELRTELRGDVSVKEYTPNTDKLSRAQPWINKIESGQFFMVEGLWNQDFLDELEQFPVGTHDDQVDAVTVMFLALKRERKLVMA